MIVRRGLNWWTWFLTVLALGAALAGSLSVIAVIAWCLLQAAFFARRERRLGALVVQTRLAFAVLLALGTLEPIAVIHWLQLVGLSVRLTLEYCLLARTLSLMPWNRRVPLSCALIYRTYMTPAGVWSLTTVAGIAADPVGVDTAAQTRRR